MRTLQEALIMHGGKNATCIIKHLGNAGISRWEDCTKAALADFVDELAGNVCRASAHTYCATLKAVLGRYSEDAPIPCKDVHTALKCRNERCQKTYLTPDEIERLERVIPYNDREKFVKLCFLVSTKTGMRISDTMRVDMNNIIDGHLTYVSEKTSIEATIPISERVKGWIEQLNGLKRPSLATYDSAIKKLCRRAGIDSEVKVFKAGKERICAKWECVSSHTARVSFCTNLSQLNVSLNDIAVLAGHTSQTMTANYIVRTTPKLSETALDFLK